MRNALSANEAKTQFGDMLLRAQRGPVQITKNGKPVAVVVSMEEYENIEAMKLQFLQSRITKLNAELEDDSLTNAMSFMDELDEGKYD